MDNEHIAATQQNPQGHRVSQDAVTAPQTDEAKQEPPDAANSRKPTHRLQGSRRAQATER